MKDRRVSLSLGLLSATLVLGGCYHAIVETGRPASGTVVENQWAHSFLAGLVPPNPLDVSSRCPSGVARVETQHSFLNSLAAAITFSIYTPMTITVQCAAAGSPDAPASSSVRLPSDADGRQMSAAIEEAALMSARTGEAAWIMVDRN
jgi:Bor protein